MSEQPGNLLEPGAAMAVRTLLGRLLTWTQYDWKVVAGEGNRARIAPFTLGGQRAADVPGRYWGVVMSAARDRGFEASHVGEEVMLVWRRELDDAEEV